MIRACGPVVVRVGVGTPPPLLDSLERMMRRLTTSERCAAVSWILFLVSFGMFGLSSRAYNSLLCSIYGNVNHPAATELYLTAISWCWVPPGLAALVVWLLWKRTQFEKTGPYAAVGMHFASVVVLAFMFFAAILPLLTTTWRLSP